ncbi:glucose dehydrogenase [FAD, quinone]-like [Epargyreus clarus]|uniref:glucose dehydrogenase [FAD, quinone]-like n=1 Tax=Epargyreus clarus TaxID=520877 RepID=UPI003C2D43D3
MEALADSIAATCPLALNGGNGSLFLNAITAVIAAHCALFADLHWPPDKADDIIGKGTNGVSYDFIIVGAGTAGSVVASRLSDIYPDRSVLLVEAGGDTGVYSEIPAFLFLNQHTDNDWNYKTEPDGRSCLGFKNNSCHWAKGKGMGGSSSINAMVYIRGHPKDFDDWKQPGSQEWGYEDLKYYFELQEEKFNISQVPRTTNEGMYAVIEQAWKEIGLTSYRYETHEGLIGTKKAFLLTKNGKRLNTAKIVLNETKNLHIIKNTTVLSLLLDMKSKLATGIKLRHSNGVMMDIKANIEVILSAGSIATPQLLMLSGIGPKQHLEDVGINCHLDLPVGHNLQDHLLFPVFLKTNQHITLTPEMINLFFLEYMLMRTGPLSNVGTIDFFGFINTKNISDHPDIQFHHIYFSKNDQFMIKVVMESIGYKNEIVEEIIALNKKQDLLAIYPTLLHPKSKGEVLLRNHDWKSKPIIKTKYLQDPDDVKTFIDAINFIHRLEETETFKSLELEILELKIPGCAGMKFNTDPYWRCYIQHIGTTVYHPVGTAKMGSDDSSVVDHKLLVHGMNNLRVVDASIMPSITGGNTMAPTLALAHKAVDIITKMYNYKDEL